MPGSRQIGVLKHPGRSDVRLQDVDLHLARVAKAMTADYLDRDDLLDCADAWLDHRLAIVEEHRVRALERAFNPAAS
jgi:hypothetical protein